MQASPSTATVGPDVRARVALGFRAHSGWAAAVAVGGSPAAPEILDRRRIEMADAAGAAQPYHAAEGRPLKEAARLLEGYRRRAGALAVEGVGALVATLRGRGQEVVAVGLLMASGRPGTSLEAILASHALIHTADGEHFRDALREAAASCGLAVHPVRERELAALAPAVLGLDADGITHRLADLGRALGPPWRQDQKQAALAAWMALVAAGRGDPDFRNQVKKG